MAICSFVGHRDVYDVDIQSRMQAVVDQLLIEHETVEFLIYPDGAFSCVFLLAALRARTNYPQKVTITLVSQYSSPRQMGNAEQSYCYISDKLVTPDIPASKKDDPTMGHKRMLQWIVQNSTHIISYFYDTLYDPDSQPVKYSKPLEIDLTTYETEAAILTAVSLMTEREQVVFQKMCEGCTLKEAGSAIGVKTERTRQILQHGCRTIRTELRRRYSKMLTAGQEPENRTCGLFALGEATYDSLTCFKRIMEFLISDYNANSIYVEGSYAHSGFLFALVDNSVSFMSRNKAHVTGLVGGKSLSENDDDLDAIKAALCPPCHAVGYVSRVDSSDNPHDFDVIADMIERTDFCICNLSTTPHAEKIRKYAAQTKRTVLLDISCLGKVGGMAQM